MCELGLILKLAENDSGSRKNRSNCIHRVYPRSKKIVQNDCEVISFRPMGKFIVLPDVEFAYI
jgi:hypothetical protein